MANNYSISACQTIITKLLPSGHPTIDRTARRLGIPVRTLQRQLRERGQSYGQLVDAVRQEQACHLLNEPGASVSDVARNLGYADPSSFSRAFQRWMGLSPSNYRRRR